MQNQDNGKQNASGIDLSQVESESGFANNPEEAVRQE